MNVLVIPEDFRKDEHILRPIVRRMFAEIGKPKAKVEVCKDPLLGGIGEAMKWDRIEEVIDMYPLVQVFLLIVDRDGNEGRRKALDNLTNRATQKLKPGRWMLAENAWQELEVWALAGVQKLPQGWRWSSVRSEVHPKDVYFVPYAKQAGLLDQPFEGRAVLARQAAANYSRVRSRCPEDIVQLELRLAHSLSTS